MVAAHRLSCLIVAVLFVCVAPSSFPASEKWPVSRGSSREPYPYRYDPAQLQTLPKAFLEDSSACVLYAGTTHLLEADGTLETITHEITRLNGRKGIDKLGEVRNIAFDPSYQKLTLHEACIHKTDGRKVSVEARHVQLRDVATDFQVYDRDKQLIISFPSLEVGDVIEVKWSVRGKHPEHGGQFFTRYSFGDASFPVAIDLFRVRLPKNKAFHHATVGGKLDPVITEEGDFRTSTWKALNCRKMPQDDNLPSREKLALSVACSTFASWAEVGTWKKRLRTDCWTCTPELRAVVQKCTKGIEKPEEKARALTYWMRRNIRYVSTGEKHDYTPHPPGVVLANRFGDCKDTSQMLAVMLREAGVPVELATLGALDDGQVIEAVPSPWGTHAILLVTLDGKPHWIDTTASLSGWDFLPRDDRDRLCYVVDDKGHLRLVRTPPLRADENRIEQITEMWLAADGSSHCERTAVSYGSAALAQRDNFLEVPEGERRRLVTGELQDANSRTRLLRLHINEAELWDYDKPVTVRTDFEILHHFSGSAEREGSVADSKIWNKLLAYPLDYERTVALNLNQPFETRHRYRLHLPAAYSLESLPRSVTFRTPWAVFERKVKSISEYEIEISFSLRLDKGMIEPSQFDAYRKFYEEVNNAYRAWLTLQPMQDLDDAPLLEAMLFWMPGDSDSTAILARLYLKKNRLAEARRILARARRARPEVAELWELSVAAAATPQEKEALQRELVRRFPQEPRHVLKLASLLVGAGQQKEARELLEPLTQKGPSASRAQAHFQLARSYYRRNELKTALEHWQKAEGLDSDAVQNVKAYHLKGRIYEEIGQPKDAEIAYEMALSMERDSELALDALIQLKMKEGNRLAGLAYLRRYAVAVGDEPLGLLLAAGYYLRLGLYEEALELARRVGERRHPYKVRRILGLVYFHRGDYMEAVKYLPDAESGSDTMAALLQTYLLLGRWSNVTVSMPVAEQIEKKSLALRKILKQLHDLQERRSQLDVLSPAPEGKAKPWSAALDLLVCAEWARAEGHFPNLVEMLVKQAFSQGVEPGSAIALRARIALEKGKLRKAGTDAEQAIARSPLDSEGWYVRGRIRLERGEKEALTDLTKAVELSEGKNADILHAQAEALFHAGRLHEALTAQRAAVKLKPKNAEMAEALATLEKSANIPRTKESNK